jgi:hypothetical protein
VLGHVDLLAVGQTRLHLLGEHGGSAEAANELLARFRALVRAAHVGDDGAGDVAVSSGNHAAAVDQSGQDDFAVRDAGARLPVRLQAHAARSIPGLVRHGL